MSATSSKTILLATPEETGVFAQKLASLCQIRDCLLLYGEVGAGKTTFARGFISCLCDTAEEIVSPTFTLVQTYPMRGEGAVWHYDLYRLKHASEIDELGLDDALEGGITLVEWPEIGMNHFPKKSLQLHLEQDGRGRKILLRGEHERWEERLQRL